jgi:hypothetical protein
MDPKAQELIDFAKENGFEIHSRTSPEEWVKTLEEHGGQCPCKHSPFCPCGDAISRIKDPARPPEDQMCGCAFYVSPAYLEYYKRQPWKPGNVTNSTPNVQKVKQVSAPTRGEYKKVRDVAPEVSKIALSKAQVYLNGLEQIKSGKLDDFTALMEQECKDSESCAMCSEDAEIASAQGKYVATLCHYGNEECENELSHLIDKTMSIIDENFMAAGLEREILPTVDAPVTSKHAGKTNAWMEFAKTIMNDPLLDGKLQKYKMRIAASIYRKEYPDIPSAMAGIPE